MKRGTTRSERNFWARAWAAATLLLMVSALLVGCAQNPSSAAPDMLTIGIVNASAVREVVVQGFKDELARLGYVEGERVRYLYEGVTSDAAARDAWAAELVAQQPDLILAVTTLGAQSAAAATDSIPVVFVPVTDPVGAGLVESLRSPGGNVTGVTNGNPHPLRLRLLHDIAPSIRRVYVPFNSESAPVVSSIASVREMAQELGLELVEADIRTEEQMVAATKTLPGDIDAIFIPPDPLIIAYSKQWAEAATALGVPVSSLSGEEVQNGVLMAYGENLTQAAIQTARMADAILKGTPPASLPVEKTDYFLSLNLAAAQAIDLSIPDDMIRRATLVVRP